MKIFIVGSCVSRDLTTYLVKKQHTLLHYAARQSLISADRPVQEDLLQSDLFSSPFQLESVTNDFKGDLYERIDAHKGDIDVILWDLIDERRGVIRISDTEYVTNNWELYVSGQIDSLKEFDLLPLGTEEHFAIWKQAVDRFIKRLEELGLLHKVLLIAPMFAHIDEDGDNVPAATGDTWQDLRNNYSKYFEYVKKKVSSESIVSIPNEALRATKNHRWGLQSFHYSTTTESRLVEEIERRLPLASLTDHQIGAVRDIEEASRTLWDQGATDIEFKETFEGVPFNAKICLRSEKESVLTLFNGALNRALSGNRTVYQRSTWESELPGNLVFISDSTTDLFPEVSVGWGQGNGDLMGTHLAAGFVRGLTRNPRTEKIERQQLLFGSSAGGFQALHAGTFLPDARILVNNPQIDWLKYEVRSAIRTVIQTAYKGESENGFRDRHETAVDLRALWRFLGQAPNFTYLLNTASPMDIELQFQPFMNFVSTNIDTLPAELSIKTYHHPTEGHNPLGKSDLVPIIQTWVKSHSPELSESL